MLRPQRAFSRKNTRICINSMWYITMYVLGGGLSIHMYAPHALCFYAVLCSRNAVHTSRMLGRRIRARFHQFVSHLCRCALVYECMLCVRWGWVGGFGTRAIEIRTSTPQNGEHAVCARDCVRVSVLFVTCCVLYTSAVCIYVPNTCCHIYVYIRIYTLHIM